MSSETLKPNLELLLNSSDLNSSIIELDNYICEWGDNLEVLTYPQMAFYFNQELEREVNNGGFDQYFWNSSGMYANETLETLKLIGANKTADILKAAIDPFPDKQVPIDRDVRDEIVESIRDANAEKWEDLDQRFFKYEDDLNALNIAFVKSNRAYFE
jgi:hypothetical protein